MPQGSSAVKTHKRPLPFTFLHSGTLRDTVKPDDGHELAETCRLILARMYILHTN